MPSHSKTGNTTNSSPPSWQRRSPRGAGGSRLLWLALMLPADGASPAGPGPVSERLPPKASIPLRRHLRRRGRRIRSINGWSGGRSSIAVLPLTIHCLRGNYLHLITRVSRRFLMPWLLRWRERLSLPNGRKRTVPGCFARQEFQWKRSRTLIGSMPLSAPLRPITLSPVGSSLMVTQQRDSSWFHIHNHPGNGVRHTS